MEYGRTIIGSPGSGKSVLLESEVDRLVSERRCSVLFLDRHGTTVRQSFGRAWAAGHKSRAFFEKVSHLDRVLSWPFWQQPTATNPLQLQVEEELEDERFNQMYLAKRGLKRGESNPWIDQYLKAGVGVWRSQPTPQHLTAILAPFEMEHWQREELLSNARASNAARTFRDLERRSLRNPNQYAVESGAAYRMLQNSVRSPAIYGRHGDSWSWEWMIKNKILLFADVSEVSEEVARAYQIAAYTAAASANKRLFDRTGEEHGLVIICEEAGAQDLVTPFALTSMMEDRKRGTKWWWVSQSSRDFGDQDAFDRLLANAPVHYWFHLDSGIDRAAEDCASRTFDPLKIHFTRTRMQQDGTYREMKTKTVSKGKGKSKDDNEFEREDSRENVSEGVHYLPNLREISEDSYMTAQMQQSEWAKTLSTHAVGQCSIVTPAGVVQRFPVKMLGDIWPLGLTDLRTDRAITECRLRPQYRPPQLPPSPPQPPPTPPPSPGSPPATPLPINPNRGGAAARFRGSSGTSS